MVFWSFQGGYKFIDSLKFDNLTFPFDNLTFIAIRHIHRGSNLLDLCNSYTFKEIIFLLKKYGEWDFLAIKHIKESSKIAEIESFAGKSKIEISTDKLKNIVENMVSAGVIQKHGEKQGVSYSFPEQSDNSIEVVSGTQEVSSEETVDSNQVENTRQKSVTPDAGNNKETETMISVLKDLDSLKSFQKTVEKNYSTRRKI